MSIIIDYDSKFLESTENLKRVLKKSLDREPSTKVATDAAVCLQHGRLYFEAAEKAPMEIKPLLIFYGMMNYSKSLVISRNLSGIETLPQKHGLNDISEAHSPLKELKVKILAEGTFQKINDTICNLDCVEILKYWMHEHVTIPTSCSNLMANKVLTLKDILARIPRLAPLFSATFSEEAKTIGCRIDYKDEASGCVELRIDDRDVFNDPQSRTSIINKWKSRYPFLDNWHLFIAERAWDHSILVFTNIDKSCIAILSEKIIERDNGNYEVGGFNNDLKHGKYKFLEFYDIIQPMSGGLTNNTSLIEPFENIHISELSLYYLGMFLLSSLVRYRPHVWRHSISRLATSELPSDDAALALIERFLEDTLTVFPSAIVKAMSMIPQRPPSL